MTSGRDYPAVALDYALGVVKGDVVTGARAQQAAQRYIDDLKATKAKGAVYRFDPQAASRVCLFAELFQHVKGRWAVRTATNDPHFRLEPWQVFALCAIFGFLNAKTGLRRFRKVSLYVPRKNGKSFLAAVIGLYMAFADAEPGAEVYSGATTEKQAWEVFGPARRMANQNLVFLEQLEVRVNAKSMVRMSDGSKFEPVIGKPGDGSSPHCAIVDEYHEHDTAELYDTMLTGMGARQQPMMLVITTAGANLASPCYDDYLTCCKILSKSINVPDHFALVYEADPTDDWTTELAMRKANPNFGVSVSGDFLVAQQRDAVTNARRQNAFKTKHLNTWVNARDAFMNMVKWGECYSPEVNREALAGRPCILAFDFASKIDIASSILLFLPTDDDPNFSVLSRNYLPEATINDPRNEHYQAWRDQGFITETPGEMIDYSIIYQDLEQDCRDFEVAEIAYDPYQATMFVNQLLAEGLPAIEFKQTVLNFSEPMKQVDALTRAGRLRHDGNPLLTWFCSNVEARVDAKDNVYPRKAGERPENKIDGFVALVMATGRAMSRVDDSGTLDEYLNDPITVGA